MGKAPTVLFEGNNVDWGVLDRSFLVFSLLSEHQEAWGQLESAWGGNGTYSKDQGGISTNACRLYLLSRGLTPGCSVGGRAEALPYVSVSALIHQTPLSEGLGQHAGPTERAPKGFF